ncbi:MAG: transporter [Planctomycetota bacterium]|nr:MAG: transporter [Planctomycetota bacterium]
MHSAISIPDAAIIVLYLTVVVGVGLWIGRRQRDVRGFLLADRELPWWLLLLSIVATETSSVTFLSVPGIAYGGDLTFLQVSIGYVVGRYVVVALLLPSYFRGQIFTAYEVLDRQFGAATKRVASLLFVVTRCAADGLRLYLTAIALRLVLFGAVREHIVQHPTFDHELFWSIVLAGGGTILYTCMGGIKAVVWTDFIQFFVYVAGALVSAVTIVIRLAESGHGWSNLPLDAAKLRVFDLSWDLANSYTLWSGILGGAFISLATHGADQLMVQRYLSARSPADAARALWASGWVVLIQFAGFLSIGLGLAAYYGGRHFATSDEVFATFIVEELPIGAIGLTLAAVFAAAMSTLSGSLNSLAGAAVNDFYLPLWAKDASPRHVLRVTRALTIAFGAIQIGVAMGGQFLSRTVVEEVMAIAGMTTGVVLGVFLLGIFTRRVQQSAAIVGIVLGLMTVVTVRFATALGWTWYSIVGAGATFLVAVGADSLLSLGKVKSP